MDFAYFKATIGITLVITFILYSLDSVNRENLMMKT
jgi:hypothetical protein